MPRTPAPNRPQVADTPHSVMERLRFLDEVGEIDLIDDTGVEITPTQANLLGPRIQSLSDHIAQLESELGDQSAQVLAGKPANVTKILEQISAARMELTGLCNSLIDAD